LLVDKQKILRQGIRLLLDRSHEFEVVGDTDGTKAVALAVMLLIVWIRFARGRADARALLLAAAAATCIYVGLGRVLSDQYVIWLIPLVAMVPFGAARLGAIGLVAILTLSNWIYPGEYAAYEREFRPQLAWVVLARVLAILVLGIYLASRADLSSGEILVSRDD